MFYKYYGGVLNHLSVYIFVFLSFVFLSAFLKKKAYFILFFILFVLFIGFRERVGGDWYSYISIYNAIGIKGDLWDAVFYTDPLYSLLNLVAYKNGLGIYFVNFICAIIFISGLLSFCSRQYDFKLALIIAIPYIVFVVGMGYTRQSAALGIILFAINMMSDGKYFKFIFFIFFAAFFHFSSIIAFSFFISKLSSRNIKLAFFVSLISFILVYIIFGDVINDKMMFYTNKNNGMYSSGAIARLFMNIIPIILFFFTIRYFKEYLYGYYNLILLISVICFSLLLLSFYFSTLSDRIGLYFSIIQILVFSNFPKFLDKDSRVIYSISICIFYFLTLFFWLNKSFYSINYWVPYSNVLFK